MYRVPVQQGNVITVEMLQELKLGMDKRKVSFILGTPLVRDAFHLDRWDYFYSYESGDSDRVQQTASLFFEADRLARIEANIDSKIDFHTVTAATDNVLIVPAKKKGGFFAAITPAFIAREEEEARQEELARSLSTGVNEQQPGSGKIGSSGEADQVLDPALAVPAAIEPGFTAGAAPSESYAPNIPSEGEAASAASRRPRTDTQVTSTETESQSRFLENLFDNFGAAPTPAATPAKSADAEPAVPEPSILTQPTRD